MRSLFSAVKLSPGRNSQSATHPPLSSLHVTMLICLNCANSFRFETSIQVPEAVRPAMNAPSTSGLPLAQLEYWTFVPSYHLIWLSTAEQHYYQRTERLHPEPVPVTTRVQSTYRCRP